MTNELFPAIRVYCAQRSEEFSLIDDHRKELLLRITAYINNKRAEKHAIQLVYVCTHNSRRSHFGQIWAAVAAAYYNIDQVTTYSGGTEATAFHPNAIAALTALGMLITPDGSPTNPIYTVQFGPEQSVHCFSKKYSDNSIPQVDFAAIMTCADAEENCPFIPGAALRIGTTYDDPKAFDGTAQQSEAYLERSAQIARETLYVFSQL